MGIFVCDNVPYFGTSWLQIFVLCFPLKETFKPLHLNVRPLLTGPFVEWNPFFRYVITKLPYGLISARELISQYPLNIALLWCKIKSLQTLFETAELWRSNHISLSAECFLLVIIGFNELDSVW